MDKDLIMVYSGTSWQANMVKGLLENNDIEAYIKDEIIGTMNPWWAAPGGAGAVRVLVSTDDIEKAIPVVEEYEKNSRG